MTDEAVLGSVDNAGDSIGSDLSVDGAADGAVSASTRQPRRTKEELRALMLEAAWQMLLEEGLSAGTDSLTFPRVFDRVERDTGLRLTNASILRRVWESQSEYHTDVLLAIASQFAFVENQTTSVVTDPLIADLDLSTPEKRLAAARECCRIGCAAVVTAMAQSAGWALWMGVWALATAGEETEQKRRVREALWASYEAGNEFYVQSYAGLSQLVGIRLREGLTIEQFVVATGALAEGCTLRNRLDDNLVGFMLPTGPDGEEQEWTLFGLGVHALIERFYEIDPDWEPPDRRRR
jgi:hypothetical protein